MLVTGSNSTKREDVVLYKDTTNLTQCSEYRSFGDNVCDDVIFISVNRDQHVRYVTISTDTVVTLCEVQIFTGEIIIVIITCIISTVMFHDLVTEPKVHLLLCRPYLRKYKHTYVLTDMNLTSKCGKYMFKCVLKGIQYKSRVVGHMFVYCYFEMNMFHFILLKYSFH